MNTELRNKLFNKIKHTFENEDTQEREAFLQAREDVNKHYVVAHNLAREVVERSYPPEDVSVLRQFKKKYGAMKSREDELDERDKAERDKNNAEEMAYEMNSYVKTLAQDRYKNLWAEAAKAKEGEDPEPVKGKKTMTGEKQEGVKINPKEAMPSPGPKVGALS